MKRLLYENGKQKVFRLTETEYIFINGKEEYFFDTKDKINQVYLNSKEELVAESPRHIWNLDKFTYLDKQSNQLKYHVNYYDLSEYKKLHPFKEYSTLCMEILSKKIDECKVTRTTPSKNWLKKQYDYNLWIVKNPGKLNTMINYILDGNYLNDRIISGKLNFMDHSYIKKLDEIFHMSPKLDKDILVYRGVGTIPDKFDITQFDKRFVSTSLLKQQALEFTSPGGILMVIKLKKGIDSLLCFSFPTIFSHETELLLPRKLKFKVTNTSIEEELFRREGRYVKLKVHVYYCEAEF